MRDAFQLNLYINEKEKEKHHPLFDLAIQEAKKVGIEGCTLFRSMESFGQDGKVHTEQILELSPEHTLLLIIVSSKDKIDAFLEKMEGRFSSAFYTITPTQVGSFRGVS